MTRLVQKTGQKTGGVAALALTASLGMALPAAADTVHHGWHRHHVASAQWNRRTAWRAGYNRGFRDGHLAAAGVVPGNPDGVVTGRSAYVAPGPAAGVPIVGDVLGNGGLLGTGVLGGNGVLGTGVLDGRGALGLGVLGL